MEPDLRLVSLSDIELQEEPDLKRLRGLIAGMKNSQVLRDPPIVAAGLGKKLIQLDGTTRLSALKAMGHTHAVVQFVNYTDPSQVSIKSWVHVSKVDQATFTHRVKSLPTVKIEDFKLGLGLSLTGHPLAIVTTIFRDGTGFSVINGTSLKQRVKTMQKVVNQYAQLIERDREVSIESMDELRNFFKKHADKNVALFFPEFAAHEIYELMRQGVVLPQGITRHIISGRVLGINYPLEWLGPKKSGLQKQEYFHSFTSQLNLRYYEESSLVSE